MQLPITDQEPIVRSGATKLLTYGSALALHLIALARIAFALVLHWFVWVCIGLHMFCMGLHWFCIGLIDFTLGATRENCPTFLRP